MDGCRTNRCITMILKCILKVQIPILVQYLASVSHNKNHCDTCNTKVSLVHLDFCFPLQQWNSFQVNVNIIYSLIKEISCPFGHLRKIMAVRSVYFIKEKNGDIICRFCFLTVLNSNYALLRRHS